MNNYYQRLQKKHEKRTGMLCGFGDQSNLITPTSKQAQAVYYCWKCKNQPILTIQEANLYIYCDFYFLCYQCQEQETTNYEPN